MRERFGSLPDVVLTRALDLDDVSSFVQALLDPAGYAAAFPDCDMLNGDMQPDGSVDGGDVQGFVDLLIMP